MPESAGRHGCQLPPGWAVDRATRRSVPPARAPGARQQPPRPVVPPPAGVPGGAASVPRSGALSAPCGAPPAARRSLGLRGGDAYVIDGFMTAGECARVVRDIGADVGPGSGWTRLPAHGLQPPWTKGFAQYAALPAVAACIARVTAAMKAAYGRLVPTGRDVYDYFLRYDAGCSMQSHTDLHLDLPQQDHCSCVLTLGLTADAEGGAFAFTNRPGASVEPAVGRLVMFSSVFPDGRPRSAAVHHVEEMRRGTRWAAGFAFDFADTCFPDDWDNEYFSD
eukprot:TRINITY_DN32610_c0_g1_i1.p1 TRINITY_DN32610_c0_g1~~TRINITY_DN32610_c0_g1_i1.p1  ORF type:complete len:315 (+),score=74.68 TRINITY_DN32610_c0_g1_i1:110-946(+)